MWYGAFAFYDKQAAASEADLQQFYQPLPPQQQAASYRFIEHTAAKAAATGFCLPGHFFIPPELQQLWQYSLSGGICGEQQDFGYFSPQEVVAYYFEYQLWYYAPNFMPIAFDGGGVFYAYDFRQPVAQPPIVAMAAGNLGESEDEYTVLGHSLAEVLAKPVSY